MSNKPKYRNDYYHTNNKNHMFGIKETPEEEVYTMKELNPKTEKYEYREIKINHKNEWENTEALLKLEIEELESEKIKL